MIYIFIIKDENRKKSEKEIVISTLEEVLPEVYAEKRIKYP